MSANSASGFSSARMPGGFSRPLHNPRFAQNASLVRGSMFRRSTGASASAFIGGRFDGFVGRGFRDFDDRGFGSFGFGGFGGFGFGPRFGCWSCGWGDWGWGWNWGLGFGWAWGWPWWGWGASWPYAWDYWDPYWYNPFWTWTSYDQSYPVSGYGGFGSDPQTSPDDANPNYSSPNNVRGLTAPPNGTSAPAAPSPLNRNDIFRSPVAPGISAPAPAAPRPLPQIHANSQPVVQT